MRAHALTYKIVLIQVELCFSDMFVYIVSKALNVRITIQRVNASIRQRDENGDIRTTLLIVHSIIMAFFLNHGDGCVLRGFAHILQYQACCLLFSFFLFFLC